MLKNGQIWAFQENMGFSRTRRTVEAVEYGDTKLVGKKSPNDFLWDGVIKSCLWYTLTILLKSKMWYIFFFPTGIKCDAVARL